MSGKHEAERTFLQETSTQKQHFQDHHLENYARLETYRLFQFTVRDVVEQYHGTTLTETVFRDAGRRAGVTFFNRFCLQACNLGVLVQILADRFSAMKIGILRVEESDEEKLHFTVTVAEDLDCSGLPDTREMSCVYDEGLLQGVLESYYQKPFLVREVDCWSNGGRICRFHARPDVPGALDAGCTRL